MKRIFSISIVLTLVGCTSSTHQIAKDETDTCPFNYSILNDDFIQSDFFEGWRYEKGIGRDIDIDKAILRYQESVNEKQYANLSAIHYDNILLKEKGYGFYEARLKSGWGGFSYIRAGEDDDYGDLTEDEAKWLVAQALCGDPVEQFAVGMLNMNGSYFEKDVDYGIYFLTLAAKQDHIRAQGHLGLALAEHGEVDVAIDWLALANENGFPSLEGGMIAFLENTK